MLKTKLFVYMGLNAVFEYQDFIRQNQHTTIISVNILEHDNVLLTYKE